MILFDLILVERDKEDGSRSRDPLNSNSQGRRNKCAKPINFSFFFFLPSWSFSLFFCANRTFSKSEYA